MNTGDIAMEPAKFKTLGDDTSDSADRELEVRGRLPQQLCGVLYRNGPGRFRRDGVVKHSLLDGDGLIQRLQVDSGGVRYSRRFVRTPKFLTEEKANRFISPTWTTKAPRWLDNVNPQVQSQAGITVRHTGSTLHALDEVAPGFELDPMTLETLGPVDLGLPDHDDGMKAHARHLAASGDWLFVSTRMGREGMRIDIVRQRPDGTRVATPTVQAPRMAYLHDFAATDRHAIFVLQPAILRPLRFLSGMASFTESLQWQPEAGNLVLLIDLASGETTTLEAPTAWIWHFANAWEHGSDVVVDFVGFDDPGHFLGPDAQLTAIMHGADGMAGAPGTLRRYVIGRDSGRLDQEILASGNFEFPSVEPHFSGERHKRIFLTQSSAPGILHNGIASFDTEHGTMDAFDFGPDVQAGEPVFVPDPDARSGWLITQTLDARRAASGFAILDAGHIADGPVATIDLGESVPLSFHGCWAAA